MASRRVPRLRTVLGAVMVRLVLLSSTVVGVLLLLSSYLEHATVELGAAIESVRLAEEVELNLLLYDRADPEARLAFEQQLRQQLLDARTFALPGRGVISCDRPRSGSRTLHPSLTRGGLSAQHFGAQAGGGGAARGRALVARSPGGHGTSSRRAWQARRHLIGTMSRRCSESAAALLFGTAGIVLWWVSTRAFRPVLDLGRVMERCGKEIGTCGLSRQAPRSFAR